MKCGKANYGLGGFFRLGLFLDCFPALVIAVLLMLGKTSAWSQDSGQKLNNSNETSPIFELNLETLNNLHSQASNQLTELTQRLNQTFQEVQTSRQQLTSLRNLLDNALQKSMDLENTNQRISEFSQQIGERLQKRDTDLANAYDKLDAQDKKILKMWIAIIALAGILVLSWILKIVITILHIRY
jgi:cell division protein ZapA (FtsZ GTPase activity inhibitor)